MSYRVQAKRWEHGWELHIDGVGVTQSRTLHDAEAMVRDYLEVDDATDARTAEIHLHLDLDGLEELIRDAKNQVALASFQQEAAAQAWRSVAARCRAVGLSVADTATALGISKGRVSQLIG